VPTVFADETRQAVHHNLGSVGMQTCVMVPQLQQSISSLKPALNMRCSKRAGFLMSVFSMFYSRSEPFSNST
jgi:hypothetical protein